MPRAAPTSDRFSPPLSLAACTDNTGRMRNRPSMRSPNTPARLAPARSSAALMRSEFTGECGAKVKRAIVASFAFSPGFLGLDSHPRRAHAQPEESFGRAAAQSPRSDHRPFGLRQELARLRYALCRGTATLRRIALGLCAAVPAAHGEARR